MASFNSYVSLPEGIQEMLRDVLGSDEDIPRARTGRRKVTK